jgi:HEAT repeat protein
MRVRDAMLTALTDDSSVGVRVEALHALETVRADSSVRRVLAGLAEKDSNQYIRRKAQDVLNAMPEID